MKNILKIFGLMSVFFLLLAPLAGCDKAPWDGAMTLILKIDEPKNDTTVTTPTIKVSGNLSGSEVAAARVKINDVDAPVKDGKFSAEVALAEGENIINVVAQAGQANLNEKVKVIYAPVK